MTKHTLRTYLSILILLVTTVLFVGFFRNHPQYWQQLRHVSPLTIVWILVLNTLMIGVLVLIGRATIQLCGKQLRFKENFLLTSYSSIANFFGPLQSGPGVRAVYLKTAHRVRLRDYTLASLIGLGMFAMYSALFLLVGTRPWWQTLGALAVVGGASYLAFHAFQKRDKRLSDSQFAGRPTVLASLMLLTFLQALLTVAWYYVELRAVNPHIHFSQALSYAGAANFSLFVSITPDAIGIRELFLQFSQHIHHVSTANILAANLIDRAAYVLFLVLLFLVVLSLHAKATLQLTKSPKQSAANDEPMPR